MERKNIALLSLFSVVAAVSIMDRSAQRLAPDYLGSPTRSSSENLSIKRYVAAGDRAYEVGTLDGAFPQIGWHVKGHMNGLWAPPIKLLDSYRFLINGQPFPNANKFISSCRACRSGSKLGLHGTRNGLVGHVPVLRPGQITVREDLEVARNREGEL